MICPACGYDNLPGSSVCEHCNTDLTQFEEKKPVTKSKIEKAILEDTLDKVGKEQSIALKVTKNLTVKEVIQKMVKEQKCSAVIMEGDSIAGIFTERSLLLRVCNESPINVDKSISEAMLRDPKTLQSCDRVVDALHMMEVGGFTYAIIEGDPLRVINIRDILEYIIEIDA
jgi:predicted transcriptional regulator